VWASHPDPGRAGRNPPCATGIVGDGEQDGTQLAARASMQGMDDMPADGFGADPGTCGGRAGGVGGLAARADDHRQPGRAALAAAGDGVGQPRRRRRTRLSEARPLRRGQPGTGRANRRCAARTPALARGNSSGRPLAGRVRAGWSRARRASSAGIPLRNPRTGKRYPTAGYAPMTINLPDQDAGCL
jgi:hypothetical protein